MGTVDLSKTNIFIFWLELTELEVRSMHRAHAGLSRTGRIVFWKWKLEKLWAAAFKLGQARGAPQRVIIKYWEYRSVLLVGFYHILPLPGVPLHSVWSGPVGDVATRFAKKWEVFLKKFFKQFIKLNELYKVFEKHLKGHIQFFCTKRRATSLSLFCSTVSGYHSYLLTYGCNRPS